MAIKLADQYPGKTAGTNTDYPLGQARNVTVPGDGTGTPWEAAIVNDDQGFKQALLEAADITPSGNPDTAVNSQYLQAINKLISDAVASLRSTQFGIGQTWRNVTGIRALGTEYTNSTPRPIMVNVSSGFTSSSNTMSATVGGVQIWNIRNDGDGSVNAHLSFVVPPGAKYSVASSAGVVIWAELRQ